MNRCAALKFCFLLDKNAAESALMLKTAYKDDVIGKTQVGIQVTCSI